MNTVRKFTRTVEDFTCEKCGCVVKGTGYTNHCPQCLWSKHVDIFPGDRLEPCGGLMEPASIVVKRDDYIITHRCIKCGYTKPNKAAPEDNFDVILAVSAKPGK